MVRAPTAIPLHVAFVLMMLLTSAWDEDNEELEDAIDGYCSQHGDDIAIWVCSFAIYQPRMVDWTEKTILKDVGPSVSVL